MCLFCIFPIQLSLKQNTRSTTSSIYDRAGRWVKTTLKKSICLWIFQKIIKNGLLPLPLLKDRFTSNIFQGSVSLPEAFKISPLFSVFFCRAQQITHLSPLIIYERSPKSMNDIHSLGVAGGDSFCVLEPDSEIGAAFLFLSFVQIVIVI